MKDTDDSSTASLRSKQRWTIIAIIVTTAMLGIGSILALETVKTSYQRTIDVLLQLKSDFQTVRQKILEIRRDETYLSDKNKQMIEIQVENIDGLKSHLQKMRTAEQSIIKESTFNSILENLDQYFNSYKKVAEWSIQEGDWDSGMIADIETEALKFDNSIGSSSQKEKDLAVQMNRYRTNYMHTNSKKFYDETLKTFQILDEELQKNQNRTAKSLALLRNVKDRFEALSELRWNIGLERANFLKTILVAEQRIQNSVIYIDNYTVEQNVGLKSLVTNVTWGLVILVLLTFIGVGLSATFFKFVSGQIDSKTEELRHRKNDIAAILNHVKLGIFTVLPDGTIHREYSRYLEDILEQAHLEGKTILKAILHASDLSKDRQSQVEHVLGSSLGESLMQYEANVHLLPREFKYTSESGNTKVLEIQWDPIEEDSLLAKQMVTVRDVTELRQIQAESERRKLELNILMEILGQPVHKIQSFFERNRAFITQPISDFQNIDDPTYHELRTTIRRNLHTFKGNARMMKFDLLANTTHIAEEYFKADTLSGERRFQCLEKVNHAFEQYFRIFNDRVMGSGNVKADGGKDLVFIAQQLQECIVRESGGIRIIDLYAQVKKMQGLTAQSIIQKSYEGIPKLIKDEGKVSGFLKEKVEEIIFTEKGASLLQNILTHLFMNAVAHGFESENERRLAKKPLHINIYVEIRQEEDEIAISFYDEGKGLAIRKIRELAAQRFPSRSFQNNLEYAQIIFEAGVSTELVVSAIAGRGVGMNAVKAFLSDIGGRIEIALGEHGLGDEFVPIRFEMFIPRVSSLVDETIQSLKKLKKAN